jgi:hypothetical protein
MTAQVLSRHASRPPGPKTRFCGPDRKQRQRAGVPVPPSSPSRSQGNEPSEVDIHRPLPCHFFTRWEMASIGSDFHSLQRAYLWGSCWSSSSRHGLACPSSSSVPNSEPCAVLVCGVRRACEMLYLLTYSTESHPTGHLPIPKKKKTRGRPTKLLLNRALKKKGMRQSCARGYVHIKTRVTEKRYNQFSNRKTRRKNCLPLPHFPPMIFTTPKPKRHGKGASSADRESPCP